MCEGVGTSIHGRKISGFEGGEGNSWSAHPMCNAWHCHTYVTHTSAILYVKSVCAVGSCLEILCYSMLCKECSQRAQ